ncbi:MAG: glycosyltransferase [Candidatus Eisenbacteria bacterium]|nr:glycosyltransferase [Candidatus Eisenbacteria bacterium]
MNDEPEARSAEPNRVDRIGLDDLGLDHRGVDPFGAEHGTVSASGPIAYVVKMFPRLSETFITNEVQELIRRGVDVRIISLMRPTGATQSTEALALAAEAIYLPDPDTQEGRALLKSAHRRLWNRDRGAYLRVFASMARRGSRKAWKRFFQAGALAEVCLEHRVSHLHAGFAHVPASVVHWAARLIGRNWSFAAHAKDLYLSDRKSLRNKLDAARFAWTCTEANGEFLRSLGSTTPVHVGYHGTRLDGPAAPRASSADRRILAVGRLVPKKGLIDLVRACALLRDQGSAFSLTVVGDGPERGPLEAEVKSLGLGEQVSFLGALPPSEVREHYRQASLFVLPCIVLENGDRDGIPNVLVEAMTAGLPVISTRVSAIPELIRDNVTGLLVDPHAPEQLAQAIRASLDDPIAARRRAEHAAIDVRERFDLSRNSERLAALMERHRRPNRALYVTGDLGIPVRGHKGASAHVRQVSERLVDAGCETTVLTSNPGPEDQNAFALPLEVVTPPRWIDAVTTRLRPGVLREGIKELRRLLLNLPMRTAVRRALAERRPDFVYERYSLSAVATGMACRAAGVPWIVEVNAPLADEEAAYRTLRFGRLTRALERWVLRNADHLFVVSHELRRWAMEQGTHPDKVSVLSNGVDGRRFHAEVDGSAVREAWGFGSEECVVVFSGSLKPWHGVQLLLEAFEKARASAPNLRLVFLGEGPEKKALEKRVKKHGLESLVKVVGAVTQDEVPACLRAADILAAPYLPQEHFYFSPLKVLEYLAVGRPIVASRLGEIPELVDHDCGRLVPAGDAATLIGALVELARDRELRVTMGAAAVARVKGNDWTDRVETILCRVESLRGMRAEERRLRIGYVLKMFPRFSETFITNEVIELEHQGVDVRAFSMKTPTGPRQAGVEAVRARTTVLPRLRALVSPGVIGAHFRCLRRSPVSYRKALWFAITRRDWRALDKFAQAVIVADHATRERIDHFHAHFASGPARVAKLAAMISEKPFSFTAHAKDLYWDGHRHGESKKLKKRVQLARFVVVVSEENKRFIESMGWKVKEGRVRPLYIGLRMDDFPFRKPSQRPASRRPLILAVGRLIEKKGFHVLIDALAVLRARGVKFRCVIAGEGPEEGRLKAQAESLGLAGAVRLVGSVPLARLRQRHYSRARVLAQPCVIAQDGDRDGIPTVLLEAMAMGVPVISTQVSGIPEAIEDGVDGYLTEPGDVTTLADRIAALLLDLNLADRLAEAGRARVLRQFDQKTNAGALKKLFHRSRLGWAPLTPRDSAAEAPGGNRADQLDRMGEVTDASFLTSPSGPAAVVLGVVGAVLTLALG